MSGLLDPESSFSSFMVGDLIIISFFGSLLSMTVLLACPSWAAVYYASVKSIRSEYGIARKEFFNSFRANLRQGIRIGLFLLLYLAAACTSVAFSNSMDPEAGMSLLYWVLARMLVLPMLLVFPWIFPLMSRFTMKDLALIQTAFYISVRHWAVTAILLSFYVAAALLIWIIPVLTLILPGVMMLIVSFLTERVFNGYIAPKEKQKEGVWKLPKEQEMN